MIAWFIDWKIISSLKEKEPDNLQSKIKNLQWRGQRAEKVIGGKIHNVLINKLGFKYGNKRIDGIGHKKVYYLES